jgi:hypothetical protein
MIQLFQFNFTPCGYWYFCIEIEFFFYHSVLEQLQQFGKQTWHPYNFGKIRLYKYSTQYLTPLTSSSFSNFLEGLS